MPESLLDTPRDRTENIAKAIRLVDYLKEVSLLRSKAIRNVESYEKTLWLNNVPKEKGCFMQAWGGNEEFPTELWGEIQSSNEPKLPSPPEDSIPWCDDTRLRKKSEKPCLLEEALFEVENPDWEEGSEEPEFIYEKRKLENHPDFSDKWEPWREAHNIWESIQNVYTEFFAIHQKLVHRRKNNYTY